MVSMFQYILPTWSECVPHNAHVVRVSHNMLYQSMRSTWSVCSSIYCPRGQSASRIIPTWSECLTMYCLYGQSVSHIMPMWSECHHILVWSERCHILRRSECHHILPTWSECLTICCFNLCGLHSQYVSVYIAHVVRVCPT